MWIRSQNKKSLTKVINVTLDIPLNSGEVGIKGYFDNNKFDMLGYYKNEERAIEVLDEIQNLLIPKVILNTYSVENKETAYSKELVIEPIINDIKVQNNVNMFYQMPEK